MDETTRRRKKKYHQHIINTSHNKKQVIKSKKFIRNLVKTFSIRQKPEDDFKDIFRGRSYKNVAKQIKDINRHE